MIASAASRSGNETYTVFVTDIDSGFEAMRQFPAETPEQAATVALADIIFDMGEDLDEEERDDEAERTGRVSIRIYRGRHTEEPPAEEMVAKLPADS